MIQNRTEQNRTEHGYHFIDLAKFIMEILVVALHARPALDISEAWNFYISGGVTRIAVPFFFTASEFFLFRKIDLKNLDWNIAKKFCYRLMKMYLIWTAIYFPIRLHSIYKADDHLHAVLSYIRDFLFIGSHYHLWYLLASVIAVLVIWHFLKKGFSLHIIDWFGFLSFIFAMLSRGYYGFYLMMFPEGTFVNNIMLMIGKVISPINGLTEGVLYMTLGAMVAKGSFSYTRKTIIIGCILSWIVWNLENMLLYEYAIYHHNGNTASLTIIPAVLFTFLLASKVNLKDWRGWMILRKMSLYVYLIHPIFLWFCAGVYRKVIGESMPHMLLFIFALIITMVVSYIIVSWGRIIYKGRHI